ncbi:MAG: hypothetical protein GY908_14035 [Flavobacteriales bacterium]|nr:hypothetical protein [Flavobacteriales bacterium]
MRGDVALLRRILLLKLYYFSSGPRERVFDRIIKERISVEKIFISSPEKSPKIIPTIEIAKKHGIPIEVLNKRDLASVFSKLDPDVLCLSLGFKYLFPQDFIDHFSLILNVHGTLLPHYSGARTLNWIIENDEKYSGVTVHQVDADIDTGPVLLQKKFSISPFDTGRSLFRKTLEFEPNVVIEALNMYKNQCLNFLDQPRNDAIQYPNRIPNHSRIDPSQSLLSLIDKIRASDPDLYPAFFEYHEEKLGVRLFRLDKKNEESDML